MKDWDGLMRVYNVHSLTVQKGRDPWEAISGRSRRDMFNLVDESIFTFRPGIASPLYNWDEG